MFLSVHALLASSLAAATSTIGNVPTAGLVLPPCQPGYAPATALLDKHDRVSWIGNDVLPNLVDSSIMMLHTHMKFVAATVFAVARTWAWADKLA